MQFLEKLVLWYIFPILSQKRASLALVIYIFKKIYFKMKSLNILKCSRLLQTNKQTNKAVIPLQNHEGKNGPVLSFATKYWYRARHHLNVEAISFAIG